MTILIFVIIMNLVNLNATRTQMSGNIVGGNFSKIEDFAYSAFLAIECHTGERKDHFICGSSIVNQAILLTAAHCLEGCNSSSHVVAYAGSEKRKKGFVQSALKYQMHKNYNPSPLANDIALVRLKDNLQLGKYVRRVSLMPKPPYFEPALVAGWGITDDIYQNKTKLLKYAKQDVWSRQCCIDVMSAPAGSFCAGVFRGTDFASKGDSGSALVVRKYIQIGLVSYRAPTISLSVVVYTDVGYFYDWIRKEAKELFCSDKTCKS